MLLVVTPTLGQSDFLDETVCSLRRFELNSTHVIVCPQVVVASIMQRYPTALVVADQGSGGMYGAINIGLQAARKLPWNWFTFINDDDLLYPGFAEMYQSASQNSFGDAGIVYGDVNMISVDGRVIYRSPVAKSVASILPLWKIGLTPFTQQGTLVKREWVERLSGFDERYRLAADMDFWCRAATQGALHTYNPSLVAGFRIRTGQLSSQQQSFDKEKIDIRSRHFGKVEPELTHHYHSILFRVQNLTSYIRRVIKHGLKRSSQYFKE